ncbi:MAG: tRNA (adenosine(37)-N6)-threonylcarbamoyltransferase complex transferase subunit TsaD [Thermoleophilia bacterium]|jgi:N6-L-threonylcarbamoyladenine synthase
MRAGRAGRREQVCVGRAASAGDVTPLWSLRPMTCADLASVTAIEEASFSNPWASALFAEELEVERSWHVVAEDTAGLPAGYIIGRCYPDEWHLMDLAISPARRRQGVGTALLLDFLEGADEAAKPVILEVRPSNTEALALYEGHGFVAIGRRPHYYGGSGEDALVMERRPLPVDLRGPGRCDGPLLAIETSCDDTAAAVLSSDGRVLASVVHSQDAIHARYGGVVPEVAGRAHVERMTAVVREALCEAGVGTEALAAVAATVGPGLIGALLVGVQTAKTIAWSRRLPFVPVNHLHGHLAATWLTDPKASFPMVTLIASGGHTSLIRVDDTRTFTLLGQTLDDAAGEAFDKGARLLGLGYPGGRELDVLAEAGDPHAFSFPVALRRSGRLDFSFSGVKTALYYLLRDMTEEQRRERAADIAASYREAIVTALLEKTLRAALDEEAETIAVAGGVAANSLLRARLVSEGRAQGLHVVVPSFAYCTDNAAMIGAAALSGPFLSYPTYLDIDASASLPLGEWAPPGRAGD